MLGWRVSLADEKMGVLLTDEGGVGCVTRRTWRFVVQVGRQVEVVELGSIEFENGRIEEVVDWIVSGVGFVGENSDSINL
jgi:hypothetical protein